jgi:hypothetical protein
MRWAFRSIFATAMLSLSVFAGAPARAQDSISERLLEDHFANVQTGSYLAGDSVAFALDSQRGNFLLRFQGSPEVFVLYVDRASMGGRVMKYDSGETAIQVSVWGGITLYTDAKPGGLPADRTGDVQPFVLPIVSMETMEDTIDGDIQRLYALWHLKLNATTDWNAIDNNAALRALYFDALENAMRGIERLGGMHAAHDALARRVDTVSLVAAGRPAINLSGKTLVVTFNPNAGYAGRASSRAIARGILQLFGLH